MRELAPDACSRNPVISLGPWTLLNFMAEAAAVGLTIAVYLSVSFRLSLSYKCTDAISFLIHCKLVYTRSLV
ncbi:hypothetical protein DENSPDRAFT_836353 [Dentipellis sp. KUC8613]|nr:hypothetical protein DENSPDRAFT_836353 [Dentipellis sp. KUC8613]